MFGTFAHATFPSLRSKPRNPIGETQFRHLSGVARSCRRCDSGRPYVRDFTTGRLIAMGSHRISFAAAPGSVGRPPCPACGPVSSGPKLARCTRRSIDYGVFVYEPCPIRRCTPPTNPAHPPTHATEPLAETSGAGPPRTVGRSPGRIGPGSQPNAARTAQSPHYQCGGQCACLQANEGGAQTPAPGGEVLDPRGT